MSKLKKIISAILFILLYLCVWAGISYLLHIGRNYPSGYDTMYHIYRAEYLLECFRSQDYYPLYNPYMYNGVQLFRYFAPASAYGIAGFSLLGEHVFPQDTYIGYELYTGFVFFLGAVGFLRAGLRRNRPFLGGFLGLIWFFTPAVLYQYFLAGNMAMGFCLAVTPFLYDAVFTYIETKDIRQLKHIVISTMALLFGHVGFGGMVILALLLCLLLYRFIMRKREKFSVVAVVLMMGTGAMVAGLWVLPSLIGGMISAGNATLSHANFQSLFITLNPLQRISAEGADLYFGLAAFLFLVFAILFSRRKEKAFFLSGLLLLLGSSELMYPVISVLPGGRYMWMLRYLTLAVCLVYFGFLYWKSLRRWIVVVVCCLLVLDMLPSLSYVYRGIGEPEETLEEFASAAMLDEAKKITKQRIAVLDQATLAATAPYCLLQTDKKTAQSFGAGFEAAYTRENITRLNEAMEQGEYTYLFDRSLALGCDTVLLKISCLKEGAYDEVAAVSSAEMMGYRQVKKQGDYILFSYATDTDCFGISTDYKALGIGTSIGSTTMVFPNMLQAESVFVDDHSFDELRRYHTVLLDHFSYHDKEKAEQLIRDLADAGVRIVINSDGIPDNRKLQLKEFLGIKAMNISFENGYPPLYYHEDVYDMDLFATPYEIWRTTYVNGLSREDGYFYDEGLRLPFLGNVYNENICVLGLNMFFHYTSTHDQTAREILEDVMDLPMYEYPKRTIVPMEVEYAPDRIIIDSPRDGVNTTIAWQDNFLFSRECGREEHLITVDSGRTVAEIVYPHKRGGMLLTIFGFCFWLILYIVLKEME